MFYTAVAAAAAIIAVYAYAFIGIVRENERTSALSDSVVAEEGQLANLQSEKDLVSTTAPERDKLDGYFVPKDGVVPFLNLLQSLGDENNLKLKVMSVDIAPAVPASDIFETVKISFEGQGAWGNAYRMAALSKLVPEAVVLTRLDIVKLDAAAPPADSKPADSKTKTPAPGPQWKIVVDMSVLKLK